jgi:hypothetical protein
VSYILSSFLKPEVSAPQMQCPVIEHNMAIWNGFVPSFTLCHKKRRFM